jgi:hypothetical protein
MREHVFWRDAFRRQKESIARMHPVVEAVRRLRGYWLDRAHPATPFEEGRALLNALAAYDSADTPTEKVLSRVHSGHQRPLRSRNCPAVDAPLPGPSASTDSGEGPEPREWRPVGAPTETYDNKGNVIVRGTHSSTMPTWSAMRAEPTGVRQIRCFRVRAKAG